MIAVRLLALVGAVLLVSESLPSRAVAADEKTGFLNRVHKDADGKDAKYVLFVPHDYKADKPYPLILFLHGAGETGTDGKKQATAGLGNAIKKREKDFPFIVVFPQAQTFGWDASNANGERAMSILSEVEKEFKTDPKRVYLTGLSMGGGGTWSFAAKYPERWAAIAPICGFIKRQPTGEDYKGIAAKIKDIPCWCFHGDADQAVPVAQSRGVIKALWEAGAHPNYTEYPGVPHNSWDKAYATADLYEWFLKHTLK